MKKSKKIEFSYPEERAYKTIWHAALVGMGIFEYSFHKSKIAKALSIGFILFHLDATIADGFNLEKTLSRRLLEAGLNAKKKKK